MGELIVNGMKWAFIIAVSLVFMSVIGNLLSLIVMVVFNNVVGEVLHVLSCCLPFNADAVFGAIQTALSGILSFMVGSKIFNLTTNKVTV